MSFHIVSVFITQKLIDLKESECTTKPRLISTLFFSLQKKIENFQIVVFLYQFFIIFAELQTALKFFLLVVQ